MTAEQADLGQRITLRPFRDDDAARLAAGCSDPLTQRFLSLLPHPYGLEDAVWWITRGAPDATEAGNPQFAIADGETDELLGGIGYYRSRYPGVAELGYWVGPWARRRAVATTAARATARHAFAAGTHRLELRTDLDNVASQRTAIAAGFRREGVERGAAGDRGGRRHDRVVWARLATDSGEPTRRALPDLPGGELTDRVVTLRPLGPADIDDTFALRGLSDVIATTVPPVTPSIESVADACRRAPADWLAGTQANCSIRDAATGAHAGEIGLYFFEPQTQQAMIGYSSTPAWRGRGYVTRAVGMLTGWAFEHTAIVRVIAGTAPDNIGSQRVLERAGFTREGYQRSRLPGPAGTRIDDIQFALIRD